MQEDTSSLLTELLDGGTILMDVFKIRGLNRYFANFRDECGWFVKIQGRSWVIIHFLLYFSRVNKQFPPWNCKFRQLPPWN